MHLKNLQGWGQVHSDSKNGISALYERVRKSYVALQKLTKA